jgi:rRNA-processing protein FCF1
MRPAEVLIDTNLLVVLVVGLVDPALIARFKRTAAYSPEDFILLATELAVYSGVVITPAILAETSNHLDKLRSPMREAALDQLRLMVGTWHEHYRLSHRVIQDAAYLRLGVTDSGICEAADASREVFTDDFALYSTLAHRGLPVVNFNHLRSARLGL